MEYVITSLLSIILALVVWRLKDWLSYKINPDIKLRRAPRNIFEHITPGTTVDKVKELLHTPYYNDDNRMTYKFKNANLEIKKDENKVSTMILILKNFGFRNKYPIHPTDYTLGKVKLRDIINSQENVGVDISSKHGQVWIERYFGNPGLYWYFTFGIFNGPGALYPYNFPKFSTEDQKVYGEYEDLKFNFIAVSKNSNEGQFFDFHAMR
jgi:hypothetical protein